MFFYECFSFLCHDHRIFITRFEIAYFIHGDERMPFRCCALSIASITLFPSFSVRPISTQLSQTWPVKAEAFYPPASGSVWPYVSTFPGWPALENSQWPHSQRLHRVLVIGGNEHDPTGYGNSFGHRHPWKARHLDIKKGDVGFVLFYLFKGLSAVFCLAAYDEIRPDLGEERFQIRP